MNPKSMFAAAVGLALVVALPAIAQAAEGDPPRSATINVETLRRKQESQQRARDLARELVSGILDLQLQQLEENGLDSLPLYRDIRQMRANIDGLIEAEMNDVVALLVRAAEEEPSQREQTFVAARQKIRDIVVRLSVERQNLLRRLKTAELAAQVKRLLAVEGVVLNATSALTDQASSRQEAALLSAAQDQRDVKALYLRLLETLQDVRGWGGEVGHGAAEGLMILKAANTSEDIDAAIRAMDAAQFSPARQKVVTVIRSLEMLLEKIEQTQGLVGADREAAIEMVRLLQERQEELRQKTRTEELRDAAIEALVQQQAGIQKDLGRLASLLDDRPTAATMVEQATAAAYQASGKIFDEKREEALVEQGKVLGNLAAIAEQLLAAADNERVDKSAAQWKESIGALTQTARQLSATRKDLAKAEPAVAKDPAAAQPHLERAAQPVAEGAEPEHLPPAAIAQRNAVADAIDMAQQAIDDPEAAPNAAAQAVEHAALVTDQAIAEINTMIADAKRRQLAVDAGELARAAEVVERAAAAARRLNDDRAQAASPARPDASPATTPESLDQQQKAIEQVLADVEQGVRNSAAAAAASIDKARQQLNDKPMAAAAELQRAANQLRASVNQRAGELAQESRRQLETVQPVRAAAEASASTRPKSLAERLEHLAEADRRLSQAAIEQQRASGRHQAAAAMELGDQVADARRAQREASQAAADLAQGKVATPLDAVVRQQGVAEKLTKLVEREEAAQAKTNSATAPSSANNNKPGDNNQSADGAKPAADPPASAATSPLDNLRAAQRAAAQAARHTLDGNASAADAARRDAEQHLARAGQQVAEQTAESMTTPAGELDAAAQRRVQEATEDARQRAAADAPEAAKGLEQAGRDSQQALQQIEQAKPAEAARSQQQIARQIDNARHELDKARQALAKRQAEQMSQQAQALAEQVPASARVDAPAATALRSAAAAAREAAERPSQDSAETASADRDVERWTERATASLAAREHRLQQDISMAQGIQNATKQQQQAASALGQLREALTPPAPSKPGSAPPPPPSKPTAAQRKQLNQAIGQFAQAQTAIGQAAEDISGQSEVANAPLRKALQEAQQLNGEMATAEGTGETAQASSAAAQGQANTNPAAAGQANAQQASAPPSQASPSGAAQPATAASMGTGFVPQSAEMTAEQLAGADRIPGLTDQNPAGDDAPNQSAAAGTDPDDPTAKGPAKSSGPQNNQSASDSATGPAQTGAAAQAKATGTSAADRKTGAHTFREEPWVAKLPPELRDAIRAQSRRPAPRAYQERLRKYFDSLE